MHRKFVIGNELSMVFLNVVMFIMFIHTLCLKWYKTPLALSCSSYRLEVALVVQGELF